MTVQIASAAGAAVTVNTTSCSLLGTTGNGLLIADVASKRVVTTIPLESPRGVAIAEDNRTAWVTLGGGHVVEVDMDAGMVLRTIAVQASPDGVGVGIRR